MLEKPDLPEALLLSRLEEAYGLGGERVSFLPLGVDMDTAVYGVEVPGNKAYFLKLCKGAFDEIIVLLPQFLHKQGNRAVIPLLETRAGSLWAELGDYKMMVYPFISGKDGYAQELSDEQWVRFGAAVKNIHTAKLPPAQRLPQESFSPIFRETVKSFQVQAEKFTFTEPVAAKFAAFLKANQRLVSRIIKRAEALGFALHARPPEMVPCHADLHAGNLLLTEDEALYIVDWDNPVYAPKELDLMHIGGSALWQGARQESLFYQGYGPAQVNQAALAYYRYERVIQDIAAFGEQILLTEAGGEDREQGYVYFTSNFLPGHEIDLAQQTDLLKWIR
jgi:spectinomycin phosphotransferase